MAGVPRGELTGRQGGMEQDTLNDILDYAKRVGEQVAAQMSRIETGTSGNAVHPPVPMVHVGLALEAARPVASVRLLQAACPVDFFSAPDGRILTTIPRLNHYEVVLFEYAE